MDPLSELLVTVLALVGCLAMPLVSIAALLGLINLTLGPLLRSGVAGGQRQRFCSPTSCGC